jgi:hypothetical protein
VRICVKRLAGYNFFNKAKENGYVSCESGFQSTVTSPENQFCIPNTESDPIRGI